MYSSKIPIRLSDVSD